MPTRRQLVERRRQQPEQVDPMERIADALEVRNELEQHKLQVRGRQALALEALARDTNPAFYEQLEAQAAEQAGEQEEDPRSERRRGRSRRGRGQAARDIHTTETTRLDRPPRFQWVVDLAGKVGKRFRTPNGPGSSADEPEQQVVAQLPPPPQVVGTEAKGYYIIAHSLSSDQQIRAGAYAVRQSADGRYFIRDVGGQTFKSMNVAMAARRQIFG